MLILDINKINMNQQPPNFFATQIAQKPIDQEQSQESIEPPSVPPQPLIQKVEEEKNSLRQLLAAFNSFDKEEKGLIKLQHVEELLSSRSIPTQNVKQYHVMSLPLFADSVSFDEFLFIFCLSENTSEKMEEKYGLCKKVDERFIEFLKLLNNYRKKSQRNGNYNEAKNSKKKVEEIRSRQLERRNKYLKILYQGQVIEAQNNQKTKFEELCRRWDHFMNEYQVNAANVVKKIKERQLTDIAQFEGKTRQELAPKMHYSKYLLQLQLKQKNLVKVQQYEKARLTQLEIEEVKAKQLREKQLADEELIELRLKAFRKQQESTISTLLQKIQKDRNEHLRQRQSQTQKLMVRNRSQLTEIDHRFNETMKRIYQALHNMGLDSDKQIKLGKK